MFPAKQRAIRLRTQRHARVAPVIQQSFVASDRTYGARRVWRDVLAAGHPVGRRQVERLMWAPAANLLDRQFVATTPNQKWVADFTSLYTVEGWLYVAAVMDVFSRRIVGWAMQSEMTAQLVTDALLTAIWCRGRSEAILHHSDRGSQYTADAFQQMLRDLGVTSSMSRSGNVWENSAMESFFSSLKTERTGRRTYGSRQSARADVFDYIERFYNPTRRYSTLGYRSPIRYEEQSQVA